MKRDWKKINNRLIEQGTIWVDLRFLENRKAELAAMNQGKEGARYEYSDSLIRYAGTVRAMFRLQFRQTQGFLDSIAKQVPELAVPCYSQINRRFNKLPVKIQLKQTADNKELVIAFDGSGKSVTNRGEWMRKIHCKGKITECKGFLKIHIAVNIKTQEITAIEVTREDVGDNTMFKPLLIQTVQNTGKKIKRALADGGYDTYENFEMLSEVGIDPVIRIDDNAITDPPPPDFIHRNRPEPIRTIHAREQLADRKKWKKKKKYGLRWIVETVFSVLDRRFGTYVTARKYKNMQQEMLFQAQLYNQLLC